MAGQLASRLALFVVSLLAASILVFAVVNVLPGDPAQVILGISATPQSVRELDRQLGLDRPGWQRYLSWTGGMLHGDFGTSVLSKSPVAPEIVRRLSVSGPLALIAIGVSLLVAIPLGVVAGTRYNRPSGSIVSALSLVGIAVPSFWAGLLLITLFSVQLRILPTGGFSSWRHPIEALRSLLLPGVTLGLVQGAVLTRYIRSAIVEVQREDFMRTARSKGLTWWQALHRHGFRNAAIPVVTVVGVQLTSLLVGAIVIENVFVLPGLGLLLYQAVGNRDLVIVQDLVMLLTAVVLTVNLLVDLCYPLIDPRIRSSL
ncbi:MAG: ABC transporter permease [Chloroflexota bacterium]